MHRFYLFLIVLHCVLNGPPVAFCDESQAEAKSYFDAYAAMMQNLTTYDVTIQLEETMEFADVIVPIGKIGWRILEDRENKFSFFAYTQKKLDVSKAISGLLDDWNGQSGVHMMLENEFQIHEVGRPLSKRSLTSRSDAYSERLFPQFLNFGLDQLGMTTMNQKSLNERILRALTGFQSVTRSAVGNGEMETVAITCELRNEFVADTYCWKFSSEFFVPVEVTFVQRNANQANDGPTSVMLKQKIDWQQHTTYGTIPVELHNSIGVILDIPNEPGTPGMRMVRGYKHQDAKLKWNELGSTEEKMKLVQPSYSYADIDRIVGVAQDK
jgi:hypothetical protein